MFITFEGIEGSSKTTQAKLLSRWLLDEKIDHLLTKEPGTILLKECQQIRHLLLSPDNDLSPRTELLLYLSDRAQHVSKCILPAIKSGQWVISDRYSLSTTVYQGHGRGFFKEMGDMFTNLLNYAQYNLVPNVTFLMDLPAEIGVSRARQSNTEFHGGDRIEREDIEFHKSLRDEFLVQAHGKDNIIIMDATKSIEELHEEVKSILCKIMQNGYK